MTQILGTGTAKTSVTAKEPVVERKPAQVFFESLALASSISGAYLWSTETSLGSSLTMGTGARTAVGMGEVAAGSRLLAAPTPLTVAIMAMFYSPGLNEGESEMLEKIRGDQLYQSQLHGQMMVGAFTRVNATVIKEDYVPEYELREIAQQKGTVRTRVRFRVVEDPATGELVTRSYQVGEGSGLDRVRVRLAKQRDKDTWVFEDPSLKGTLIWSRSTKQGRFERASQQTTIHEGTPGGYTTPPTPIPESQGVWGLPNPAPEPLPPLPGTPIPDQQQPTIETFPIEERDFDDFIIVDPMGEVPAIYVYFSKPPVKNYEVDYYGNFDRRPRLGKYQVDHIPSQAAVRIFLKKKYPRLSDARIDEMVDMVAAVAIPKEVHQKCSETYGQRNNTNINIGGGQAIPKKELDARDLEAAVDSNWDANAQCLKINYGVTDEQIEEIRAKLHELNRKAGLY
ncbi:S-type Pyocin [Serratia sp. S1B]|nr:S-type Pyocin [Serratia sp. S1B]